MTAKVCVYISYNYRDKKAGCYGFILMNDKKYIKKDFTEGTVYKKNLCKFLGGLLSFIPEGTPIILLTKSETHYTFLLAKIRGFNTKLKKEKYAYLEHDEYYTELGKAVETHPIAIEFISEKHPYMKEVMQESNKIRLAGST